MSEKRVLLDLASFMDSRHALAVSSAPTATIRTVVERFLRACYEDVGKPPHELDGEGFTAAVAQCLPRRFGVKDEAAGCVAEVLEHFLQHLDETEVVTHKFEVQLAFDGAVAAFGDAVGSGSAHADGVVVGRGKTIKNDVARTGRNDPCPCGSGKKFKKCCMNL